MNDRSEADGSADSQAFEQSGHTRFALRLASRRASEFIHVVDIGWHRWDGCRWVLDKDDAAVTRAVTGILGDAWREMSRLDDDARKQLGRDIRACESAAGTAGVLQLARR